MPRYIDADIALDKMKNWHTQERLMDCVRDMPTADVVEVKHGKWLDYSDDFDRGMDLRCSICNNRASAFVGGTEDWWDSWEPNYCPHCGAKMDGVSKERGGDK